MARPQRANAQSLSLYYFPVILLEDVRIRELYVREHLYFDPDYGRVDFDPKLSVVENLNNLYGYGFETAEEEEETPSQIPAPNLDSSALIDTPLEFSTPIDYFLGQDSPIWHDKSARDRYFYASDELNLPVKTISIFCDGYLSSTGYVNEKGLPYHPDVAVFLTNQGCIVPPYQPGYATKSWIYDNFSGNKQLITNPLEVSSFSASDVSGYPLEMASALSSLECSQITISNPSGWLLSTFIIQTNYEGNSSAVDAATYPFDFIDSARQTSLTGGTTGSYQPGEPPDSGTVPSTPKKTSVSGAEEYPPSLADLEDIVIVSICAIRKYCKDTSLISFSECHNWKRDRRTGEITKDQGLPSQKAPKPNTINISIRRSIERGEMAYPHGHLVYSPEGGVSWDTLPYVGGSEDKPTGDKGDCGLPKFAIEYPDLNMFEIFRQQLYPEYYPAYPSGVTGGVLGSQANGTDARDRVDFKQFVKTYTSKDTGESVHISNYSFPYGTPIENPPGSNTYSIVDAFVNFAGSPNQYDYLKDIRIASIKNEIFKDLGISTYKVTQARKKVFRPGSWPRPDPGRLCLKFKKKETTTLRGAFTVGLTGASAPTDPIGIFLRNTFETSFKSVMDSLGGQYIPRSNVYDRDSGLKRFCQLMLQQGQNGAFLTGARSLLASLGKGCCP